MNHIANTAGSAIKDGKSLSSHISKKKMYFFNMEHLYYVIL